MTVLELVLALVPGLIVVGTVFLLVPHVRQFSQDTPRRVEAQQRLWWAAERLVAAIRATQGPLPMADGLYRLSRAAPVIRLVSTAETIDGIELMMPTGTGVARLRASMSGAGGDLSLDASPCAALGTVCGFSANDVAVVVDGVGHAEVFDVTLATKAGASLRPRVPLHYAYQTGAWVVAVRVERWTAERDPAGGWMLRRRTGAGAVETMADRLREVRITAWGESMAPTARWVTPMRAVVSYGLPLPDAQLLAGLDAETPCGWHWSGTGWLSQLHTWGATAVAPFPLARMSDGPWCGGIGSPSAFDADLMRLARIDVHLEAAIDGVGSQTVTVDRTVGWRP
ncbi:MAG: hypothetical protein FJW29_06085 [Acidobacteria bacterium]|nr:hypothetical protein [Acidobacteriota bacterium]